MRLELLMATAFAVFTPGAMTGAESEKATVDLRSSLLAMGLPLAESDKGVYGFHLTAQVDKKGEGSGTLELDLNAPTFDEFGFVTTAAAMPPLKLECMLGFVKKRRFEFPGPGPLRKEEWHLFEIRGPKITSGLFLATMADRSSGRLLVHGKDGKVKYAISLRKPLLVQPCHPGCFPAGTLILVPGGTKPIERVREGDLIMTVDPDGNGSPGKVAAVFVTTNRLVKVATDAGNLVTTETQPLSLVGGGLRAAGALKAGDRICRWEGGKRQVITVRSVSATGREERVFNLVVGDHAIFVADGFLARSKPPAPASPERAEERP
jgi:hypothetical protein